MYKCGEFLHKTNQPFLQPARNPTFKSDSPPFTIVEQKKLRKLFFSGGIIEIKKQQPAKATKKPGLSPPTPLSLPLCHLLLSFPSN